MYALCFRTCLRVFTKIQEFILIILHIGLEKTGTSAIQAYLSSIRNRLYSEAVLYPEIDHPHGHHALAAACGFSVPVEIGDVMKKFQSQCHNWKGTIVLSSENFSIYGTESKLTLLAENLRITGHQVSVIMYYREKMQWLHSVYHERRRWGLDESLKIFEAKAIPHYENLPSMWQKVFDNVQVKRYKSDMCSTFLCDIGLASFAPTGPEKRVHESLHKAPDDKSWGWDAPELTAIVNDSA